MGSEKLYAVALAGEIPARNLAYVNRERLVRELLDKGLTITQISLHTKLSESEIIRYLDR